MDVWVLCPYMVRGEIPALLAVPISAGDGTVPKMGRRRNTTITKKQPPMGYTTYYEFELCVHTVDNKPPTQQMQTFMNSLVYDKGRKQIMDINHTQNWHLHFQLEEDGRLDPDIMAKVFYIDDCLSAFNKLATMDLRQPCKHIITGKIIATTEHGETHVLKFKDGQLQRAPSITIDEDEYLTTLADNMKLKEQVKEQKECNEKLQFQKDGLAEALEENNVEYLKLKEDFDELMKELVKASAQLRQERELTQKLQDERAMYAAASPHQYARRPVGWPCWTEHGFGVV